MSIEAALAGAFALLILVAVVAGIVTHEVRKGPPKKPNVRVPKETLWARTNRYHEDQS